MKNSPMSITLLYIIACAVLLWSGIGPYDRFTWILEVGPGVIGIVLAGYFVAKNKISHLALIAIALHSIVLFVGGKYTYARVPIGDWVGDLAGWERNHYDRFAHVAQGFFPAIFFREMVHNKVKTTSLFWSGVVIFSMCLAFSAFYEIIEFAVAKISGEGADEFLGTQGDQWDTQWDMTMAMIGSIGSILLLGGWHRRQLALKQRN